MDIGPLRRCFLEILGSYRLDTRFENLRRDIRYLERALQEQREPGWKAQPNYQIQVLDNLFYRNKAAYVVGRLINGEIKQPFVIPILRKDENTLAVDALLMRQKDVEVAVLEVARGGLLRRGLGVENADVAVVTSLSGHFCIRELENVSPLPILNALPALDRHFEQLGVGRVGLLGTRTVMESKLYGGISSAEIVMPRGADLDTVSDTYIAIATAVSATDEQREMNARIFISAPQCEQVSGSTS